MRSSNQLSERDAPFQLRGNSFTMMVLKLIAPDDATFFPQLLNKIRQAPNFFRNAPVVLDLDDMVSGIRDFDFAGFKEKLGEINLVAVGIQGGARELQDSALAAGLTLIPAARASRPEPTPIEDPGPANPGPANPGLANPGLANPGLANPGLANPGLANPNPGRPEPVLRAPAVRAPEPQFQKATLIVTEPVRSGRQVYAAKGDLVILGPVSAGAEVLADGNIHIYNTLRGRALAGITGDTSARIFCNSLEAELVSIAGLYRVSEDLDRNVYKKQVQIYLDDGYLRMDALA